MESAVNDDSCDEVIITGDFNDKQGEPNSRISRICATYSLEQLINDPTNFTENSSSVIDLIVTSCIDFVPYTGVGPPLLDQVRYHCPVIGILNSPKPTNSSF